MGFKSKLPLKIEHILFFPRLKLYNKECSRLRISQNEGQKHHVQHHTDVVMHHVLIRGHEDSLQDGREDEAQAVDNVKPFKTNGVLDPWLPLLVVLQAEEKPDADGGDHQEGGS